MQEIPSILESLERVPGVFTPFIQGIPKDQLTVRRGEGFWTIAEHVHHLDDLHPTFCKRVEKFLTQATPDIVSHSMPQYGPDFPAIDVDTCLTGFAAGRKDLMALLRQAGPEVWKKESSHPSFTHFDFLFMVRHFLAHDYWHIYRIEALWRGKAENLKPL